MKKTNKNILLLIKIPPPVTGATLMNQRVSESQLLRSIFNIKTIGISYAKDVNNLGKFGIRKVLILISSLMKLVVSLSLKKYKFVYFQISPTGFVFYRDLLFVIIIKIFRTKILYHLHGKGVNKVVQNKFHKFFYTFVFRNEEVICLSNTLTFDIKEVHSARIHIVNNGIPSISGGLIKNNSKSDRVKFLFLSNLIKSKGVLDLIEAVVILQNNKYLNPFQLTIVGGKGDISVDGLERVIYEKGLSNIIKCTGPMYGLEKNEVLRNSDVFIFPTKNDSFPTVLLEAMQSGLPIIATNEGAIPEIIDAGITGFIISKSKPEELAKKMEYMIMNKQEIEKMGFAGKANFEKKYTIQVFENNMVNVFKKVLACAE